MFAFMLSTFGCIHLVEFKMKHNDLKLEIKTNITYPKGEVY